MSHPFVEEFHPAWYPQHAASTPSYGYDGVAVGADPGVVGSTPMNSEATLAVKLVGAALAMAAAYYLGLRSGKITGFVHGTVHGERLAMEEIQTHATIHQPLYGAPPPPPPRYGYRHHNDHDYDE